MRVFRRGQEVGKTALNLFFLRCRLKLVELRPASARFVKTVWNGVKRGRTRLGMRHRRILTVLEEAQAPLTRRELEWAIEERFGDEEFFRHDAAPLQKLLVFRYIVRDEGKRYVITELGKEALRGPVAPVKEVDLGWLEHFARKSW